ncbi:MAG: thioredoxin domain-containing protein [bacterium]|nr:thioredoxin domain-containing protein [bacterium]
MKKSKVQSNPVEMVAKTVQSAPQSNNLMFVLLIIIALFSAYLFIKVQNLEKKLAAGGAQAPTDSPISVTNLKKYAKEIGLNTGKFNKCLDSDQTKAAVNTDTAYGSSFGIQGTPGFFINGRLLAGAFPFELLKEIIDREIAETGSDNCNDYSDNLKKYCQDSQQKPFDPVAKKIDAGNAPFEGSKDAKVTIIEFSDFQCPYCIRAYPTVKQIISTYKNEIKFVFKQFPLTSIHPFAQKAAEASLCAFAQGNDKFWKMHNKIFDVESSNQAQ